MTERLIADYVALFGGASVRREGRNVILTMPFEDAESLALELDYLGHNDRGWREMGMGIFTVTAALTDGSPDA